MKTRILTALALFPPVIYLLGWSPLWLFLLATVIVASLALTEYFHIARAAGLASHPAAGYLAVALVCLAQTFELERPGSLTLAAVAVGILLIASLALPGSLKSYPSAVATTLFGVLYIGVSLSFLIPVRYTDPDEGRHWIFVLFVAIWAGDIFAYFVGRQFGRHPLAPQISPQKTLEGAVAGLAGSLLAAWAYQYFFWQTVSLKGVMLLAGLIAVAGQLGDLAESALKRSGNVKDSGALLPGHGGILDRIDSLLFGAPALWLAWAFRDLWWP
jgi:phosphatidate cytidylyltransferase